MDLRKFQDTVLPSEGNCPEGLEAVNLFNCPGNTLSQTVIDIEGNCKIAKISSVFNKLLSTPWKHCGISTVIKKMKVYRAMVLAVLLYACETWTVY